MYPIGQREQFFIKPFNSLPAAYQKSYFTPMARVIKAICVSSVCNSVQAISNLGSTVHDVCAKVHVLFLHMYANILDSKPMHTLLTRVLTLVVYDKGSTQKLEAARKVLASDVNGEHYAQTARFLGSYVSQYLKSAVEHGTTMPEELKSPWLKELLWKKPDGTLAYTFKGKLFSLLVLENTDLFSLYIELALLGGFERLATHIRSKQNEDTFAVLHLLKDLLFEATGHLRGCLAKKEEPIAEQEQVVVADTIETLFSLLLPNIDDLELPLRDSLLPHVRPFLVSLLKTEVFPQLLMDGLALAKTPYVKTLLINEGLMLEKENIEREYRPLVPALNLAYPQHKAKELEQILQPCFQVGLSYALPDFNSILKNDTAVGLLAGAAAEAMIEELPKISLQEVVRLVIEKTLPALNEGGVWGVVDGKRAFQPAAFRFEHSQEVKLANEAQLAQKLSAERVRLEYLRTTTGANPLRLFQLFQSTIFRTNHAIYAQPEQESTSWFGSALTSALTAYSKVTNQVAQVLVQRSSIKEFINKLNLSIPSSLLRPEHERIYAVAAKVILKRLKL